MVPAEDGVGLATDIVRPDGSGPFPVILIRTSYHRQQLIADIGTGAVGRFLERGYAVAAQDVRGKFDSDGTFRPLEDEARDGAAALDWIANQKWCNGNIGLWGRSYLGIVQVPAASSGHPALKAIAPSIAPGSFFRDWARYDGCFALYNMIRWPLQHASCRTRAAIGHFRYEDTWKVRSVDDLESLTGIHAPFLRKVIAHDTDDAFWASVDQCRLHERIRVPGYHVGGWFDHITRGQFDAFRNISDRGATETARKQQRLLIGPYSHMTLGGTASVQHRLGGWEFGDEAELDVLPLEIRMFDHYLRGIDNGFEREPNVKVFLLGENRWIELSDWPPREATSQAWYLCPERKLAPDDPTGEASDECVFDPADPVVTCGGQVYWGHAEQLENCLGPVDQRTLLRRDDVFCFRSDPLARPLTVAGESALDVSISSDVDDADLIAKLCVEEADGKMTCLALGQLRCRYRESFASPKPLSANAATPVHLRFYPIAYRFPVGSRIGLLVTWSDFPRISLNAGTMDPPLSGIAPRKARNAIHYGQGSQSRLTLPVVAID